MARALVGEPELLAGRTAAAEDPFVLVVSDYPPFAGGVGLSSCIILGRLFEAYPRDRIAFACLARHRYAGAVPSSIPPERIHALGETFGARVDRVVAASRRVGSVPSAVARWLDGRLHRRLCRELRAVVASYGTVDVVFSAPIERGILFRAAATMCREDGTAFAAYFLDDWRNWHAGRPTGPQIADWQDEALRTASRVFSIGPGMRDRFRTEYGIESDILPQVVDTDRFFRRASDPDHSGPLRIAFTGTIYGAQDDALDVLVRALDVVNAGRSEPEVVLGLCSNFSDGMLAARGWKRDYVVAHGPVPASVVPFVLACADLLYVPLSFKPELELTVSTSVPGKLSEYAASGRAILVHTPEYADISRICKAHDFGLVYNSCDVEGLAGLLRGLCEDRSLLVAHGERSLAAAAQYDQHLVQQRLYTTIRQIEPARHGGAGHPTA